LALRLLRYEYRQEIAWSRVRITHLYISHISDCRSLVPLTTIATATTTTTTISDLNACIVEDIYHKCMDKGDYTHIPEVLLSSSPMLPSTLQSADRTLLLDWTCIPSMSDLHVDHLAGCSCGQVALPHPGW
jgi:hypothetical protein